NGELARCFAYVRAVEARTDALPHVHLFGRAGVGAAQAHARAIHQMVRRIAERLVDVPGDVRVKCDHLSDGHWSVPPSPSRASEETAQRFRPGMRAGGQPRAHSCPVALPRVANQMSGAEDVLPARADEKVRIAPSQLMNGRASNPSELRSCRWIAGPNGPDVLDL